MLGRKGSNLRIVGPEPTALPLGYSPISVASQQNEQLTEKIKNKNKEKSSSRIVLQIQGEIKDP